MRRSLAGFGVACAVGLGPVVVSSLNAEGTTVVSYHDLSGTPLTPLGPLRVKGYIGKVGSFVLGEIPAGYQATAHHHAAEQVNVGLAGSMQVTIGGVRHSLNVLGASIAPPDAQHFIGNGNPSETAVGLEFQPVRRTDWLPPYVNPGISASAAPAPVSPNLAVAIDLISSSDGWTTLDDGARWKSLEGQTCRIVAWDLSTEHATGVIAGAGIRRAEHFVWVVEGRAQVIAGGTRRALGSQVLAVVSPSANDVRLGAAAAGRTVLLVFDAFTG